MTDLPDIIARLEKATGPDRELDAAIADWLGIAVDNDVGAFLPYFTRSIDDALGLVPQGFDAQVIWSGASAPAHCRGGAVVSQPTKNWSKKDRGEICATSHHKPTPALALCIAALKARSPA